MGEVYLAHDSGLGREVALKVLPSAFADDATRMTRFRREARVLASLNHPNIAAIYGLEESGLTPALVMELVEGSTLAECIAGYSPEPASPGVATGLSHQPADDAVKSSKLRGSSQRRPLQLGECLEIARQMADALEAAHEKGIIHRDLKPANVKIRPDGVVKVLDFGLAKAFHSPDSGVNLNQTHALTASIDPDRPGIIVGTASYMSPEQARGEELDKRTDIWSFACVLYELLTGKPAFGKATLSDTFAAILGGEPEWQALPEGLPTSVRTLLRRCLQKDPKLRLHDIADARIEIEDALRRPGDAETLGEQPKSPTRLPRWVLAGILLASIMAGVLLSTLRRAPPRSRVVTRFVVSLPGSDRLALGLTPAVALSPDGSLLVYAADHGGVTQLYLRSMDRLEATAIPGTEGASSPFFSPEGRWLGFFADGRLKKVSLSGGGALVLCNAPFGRGATWAADDTIIFAPSLASGLFRVSAAGGTPQALTTPDHTQGEFGHRWPEILPGGQELLFTIWRGTNADEARIGLLSLETGERRVLIEGGAGAHYLPSGHLVYVRGDQLLAIPFDFRTQQVWGTPAAILEGVSMGGAGAADFSSSLDGSVAYISGGLHLGVGALVWVDRHGAPQPLPLPPRPYVFPRLSPDGRQLAVGITGTNAGLWLYELSRGTLTRLASTSNVPLPIWTPDGKHLTFRPAAGISSNLYSIPADGSGAAEPLLTSENPQWPGSWTPDGKVLAFQQVDPRTGFDIWILRREGELNPQPFLQSPANEGAPAFSPDGHWLAYVSDESGRNEVYVVPFPGPGGKWQISTEGGAEPVWAWNRKELFYRSGSRMMAVTVATQPAFVAAKRQLLFEGPYEPGFSGAGLPNYDITRDGQRFVMIQGTERPSLPTQITVVLNWSEELKARIAAGEKR